MSWNQILYERHLCTRRFGRECVWFEEVDSTNRWLADNLGKFTMSGGVVVCDHQTRGRGRYDRSWYDHPGTCLLFSLLLWQPSESCVSGFMSLLPAIAIADILRIRGNGQARVSLKWPNDVLLNDRKVAGILGQNLSSDKTRHSIVGAGLNLDLAESDFPSDIRDKATSLRREGITEISREILLAEILSKWESLFDEYLSGNTRDIVMRWEQFGPELGSLMVCSNGREKMKGRFAGLGDRGQLRLQTEDEKVVEMFSGDLEV